MQMNGYDVNELQWKGIARLGFETAKTRVLSAETARQRNASHGRGVADAGNGNACKCMGVA